MFYRQFQCYQLLMIKGKGFRMSPWFDGFLWGVWVTFIFITIVLDAMGVLPLFAIGGQ